MEMNSAPVTLNGQVWISNGKKSNWKWELDLSWTRIISLRCCPFPGGLRCVIVVSETAEVCPSGTRTPCECVVAVGKRKGKKIPDFCWKKKIDFDPKERTLSSGLYSGSQFVTAQQCSVLRVLIKCTYIGHFNYDLEFTIRFCVRPSLYSFCWFYYYPHHHNNSVVWKCSMHDHRPEDSPSQSFNVGRWLCCIWNLLGKVVKNNR